MALWKTCSFLRFNCSAILRNISIQNSKYSKEEPAKDVSSKSLKPKKPGSPFLLFSTRIRKEFARDPRDKEGNHKYEGNINLAMIAKLWAELPEKEKEKYRSEYTALYNEYKINMKNFIEDFGTGAYKTTMSKASWRKGLKMAGKPIKPVNPYLIYLSELKKDTPEEIHLAPTKWKEMDDEEKSIYVDKYKIALEKYDKELLNWEIEMFNKGVYNAVRGTTLKKLKKGEPV